MQPTGIGISIIPPSFEFASGQREGARREANPSPFDGARSPTQAGTNPDDPVSYTAGTPTTVY